jgi:arylsulfatase A-like enzyme
MSRQYYFEFAFCCLQLVLFAVSPASSAEPDHPNIIWIISDDCGYNEFSLHGAKSFPTPRIDSIAAAGVRFTNGYVSGCVCSPTRAGLLTGRYQQTFGHEFNVPPTYSEKNGLPLSETLLPTILGKAGYESIAIGKWHLGYAPKFHPLERGFTHFYGFLQGSRSYFPLEKPSRLNQLLRDREPLKPEPPEYMTDQLANEAAAYINATKQKPFFMYLAFNATHTPLHATAADVQQAKGNKIAALTIALDRGVGIVLEALEKNNLRDKTLVVFINDNGGAGGHDNAPFQGKKGTMWEGGIRVPLVMQWPTQLKPGQVYEHPVISLDLFPTALAAAGVTEQSALELHGRNLLPHLRGETPARPHQVLYWKMGSKWAIRYGDLKLAVPTGEEKPHLYDLKIDQDEQQDLATQRPDDVARLTVLYERWKATHQPTAWGKDSKEED